MSKRVLAASVLGLVVILFVAWSQPWFTLTIDPAESHIGEVTISGQSASFLPGALALVLLACGLVLLSAQRWTGLIFCIVLALTSVSDAFVTLLVVLHPIAYATKQLSALSGVSGTDALTALVVGTRYEWGIWVALIAPIGIFVVSIVGVVASSGWRRQSRRYTVASRRGTTPAPTSSSSLASKQADFSETRIDDWDAITQGDDPTT